GSRSRIMILHTDRQPLGELILSRTANRACSSNRAALHHNSNPSQSPVFVNTRFVQNVSSIGTLTGIRASAKVRLRRQGQSEVSRIRRSNLIKGGRRTFYLLQTVPVTN